MNRASLILLIAGLVLLPKAAWSATATIGATKDNSIFENDSTKSAGGAPAILVGSNGNGSPRRGLVAFDVAGNVPAGATISSAQLILYMGNEPLSEYQDIELHRLTSDWGEGTAGSTNLRITMNGMGFPASAGDATWIDARYQNVVWNNPGGDFKPNASATASVGDSIDRAFTWSSPEVVSDVQGWLDAPTTNFGWLLLNANETADRSLKVFYSREATQNSSNLPETLDPTCRPTLQITYESAMLPTGDYNENGSVDAADYVLWRKAFGLPASPPGSGADGYNDGMINDLDYDYWRARFGNPASAAGIGAAVPEPSTTISWLAGLWLLNTFQSMNARTGPVRSKT